MQTSTKPSYQPPRAGGLPLVGVLPEMLRDPLKCFTAAAQRGGVVLLGPRTYLVTDMDAARHILVVNQQNYQRPGIFRRLESLVGNGLFLSTGDVWLRQRRLMQPVFHRKRLDGMADQIIGAIDAALATWQGQIDIVEAQMRLMLTVAFRLLLGRDEADSDVAKLGQHFRDAMNHLDRRLNRVVSWPWPTAADRRYQQTLQALNSWVYALIAERRAAEPVHDDLLGMLLAARDPETGQGMSDKELRDEVLTMLLAGHESTASAISWALALLAAHPAVAALLRDEVDRVLGDAVPHIDDLPNLRYARAIVDETLRLYPTGSWMISRTATAADQIGSYHIPAGSTVITSPWIIHRLPYLWPEPHTFMPERWLDAPKPPQFAYFPFGAGPRMCIGQHLALLEMTLVLVRFAQRCDIEVDGDLPGPIAKITVQPDRRLAARVRARSCRAVAVEV